MEMLTVKRVCDECGVKLPVEVKQILFTMQHITEIEDLGWVKYFTVFLLCFEVGHGYYADVRILGVIKCGCGCG